MTEYQPKPGHKVKHIMEGERVFTVKETYEDIPYVKCEEPWTSFHVANLIYIPRHVADANHHAFPHSDPESFYSDPDWSDHNYFYAAYRPKHRA